MPRIAIFGGSGYLASLIKNQNNIKKNKYTFFSRKKKSNNYVNYLKIKKNLNFFKNFDFIIHLAGPNHDQLIKNKNLLSSKNQITSNICDLCLAHKTKLIYISSMQVYKNYGISNISIKSKINKKNIYAKSHYESENIIKKKFLNHPNMFIILRMGNVFGFKKFENLGIINKNTIHSLFIEAIKKKTILIKNGSIHRTLIPSEIFIKIINSIIKKNLFKNSLENICYKYFSLKDVALIIQKRSKLLLNMNISIIIKKFTIKKKFVINSNKNFKFNPTNKKIFFEIDRILKNNKLKN